MRGATDLRIRTRDFATQVIRLYRQLPRWGEGRVLGSQLLRSGTSVGAHYREAIRARSNAEYAAKLTGGLMELEETDYWLELIQLELRADPDLTKLRQEAFELMAIFVTMIKKSKLPKKPAELS